MATPEDAPRNDSSEFGKKFGEESAATLFQLVWGAIKAVKNRAWEEALVLKAVHSYMENYEERHGHVKPLGMDQPVPLQEIYTTVRVVPPNYLGAFRERDEMEKSFRSQGRRHLQIDRDDSRDGIDVANEHTFLNLLGPPGAGKSTFLARLGYEAMLCHYAGEFQSIVSRYKHNKLPVLLQLRSFRDFVGQPDLLEALAKEFSVCGFPESKAFVKRMLEGGHVLVLLDGLDEVPKRLLDAVIAGVRDFSHQYGKGGNRFVTSCRTAHYKNFFDKFTDVVIADFSDSQIAQFASNWFRSSRDREARTAESFLERINGEANAATRELARTPLLLTFLCVTYDEHQDLPRARARLYQEALDILLRKWAAKKRVHNEPVYQELHLDLELAMLARMAADFFERSRYFFTRLEALEGINAFMTGVLDSPKILDAGQIFTAIEVQQGLLVQRAADAWSFSHLTIQEYLTARLYWDSQGWRDIVNQHLLDPRWREVILMMAGLGQTVGQADSLLLAMCQRVLQLIQDQLPLLPRLVQLAEEMAVASNHNSLNQQQVLAARLLAFGLVIELTLPHVEHRARACTSATNLAVSLGIVPSSARTRRGGRVQNQNLLETLLKQDLCSPTWRARLLLLEEGEREQTAWLKQWNLPDSTEFNLVKIETIQTFLSACQLVYDCRQAATLVSPSAWDEVCSRLVRVPNKHDFLQSKTTDF